jgi:hypothetical protein
MKFQTAALFVSLAFSSSACVTLEAPLCDSANMEDVMGLEGYFQLKMYSFEDLEMQTVTFSFERKGKGLYEIDEGGELRTCRIGGLYYVQALNNDGEGLTPYRIEGTWNERGLQGFQLMLLGASRSLLDRKGFPYRIIEKGEADSKERSLLLLNSGHSSDLTAQVIDAMGWSMTFLPVRSAQPETEESRALKKRLIEELRRQIRAAKTTIE